LKKLIFVSDLCTGCKACELACSFKHEKLFSPALSRIRIVRNDEDGFDIPTGCEQCEDAPCMVVCPTKALTRDGETGVVLLNMDLCIGCKQCMTVCPFGAIVYDPSTGRFLKCEYCDGDPECVKWCFTQAVRWEEPAEVSRDQRAKHADRKMKAMVEDRSEGGG
jgi:Fe-S-cluster-containing hydrogenase component 2